MANVLTEDIPVKCAAGATPAPHGGTLGASGTSRLRVDGSKVLTQANVLGATIANCGNTDTAHGQVKCTKATSATAASRLRVEGNPVVLDSISGATNGTPPGVLKSEAGHGRLRSE